MDVTLAAALLAGSWGPAAAQERRSKTDDQELRRRAPERRPGDEDDTRSVVRGEGDRAQARLERDLAQAPGRCGRGAEERALALFPGISRSGITIAAFPIQTSCPITARRLARCAKKAASSSASSKYQLER